MRCGIDTLALCNYFEFALLDDVLPKAKHIKKSKDKYDIPAEVAVYFS